MFRLFYGPEPFFHFGPESVPVYYLTGIRLCTCVGASSYQHVNENYFPPLQKNNTEHIHRTQHHQQQERTLAIQLLHHEYGAPQHHLPMPPTKATGGIKKNAVNTPPQHHCRRRGTRGPIWTGEGAAAPFYGVRILGEIWPVGGLIPWPNRNGRT
jgi:hypothetical protein